MTIGPADQESWKSLFKTGRTLIRASDLRIGETLENGPSRFAFADVKYLRNNKSILAFKSIEAEISSPPGLFEASEIRGKATLDRGGSIAFQVNLPQDHIPNLSEADLTNLRLKFDRVPIRSILNVLVGDEDEPVPVWQRKGLMSGTAKFGVGDDLHTGTFNIALSGVLLEFDCRHRTSRWSGCSRKKVLLEKTPIQASVNNGVISLKKPIDIKIHDAATTAKVYGVINLDVNVASELKLTLPRNTQVASMMRGMFLCKPKKSPTFDVKGEFGNYTCK